MKRKMERVAGLEDWEDRLEAAAEAAGDAKGVSLWGSPPARRTRCSVAAHHALRRHRLRRQRAACAAPASLAATPPPC